jgi:hypothetical protein
MPAKAQAFLRKKSTKVKVHRERHRPLGLPVLPAPAAENNDPREENNVQSQFQEMCMDPIIMASLTGSMYYLVIPSFKCNHILFTYKNNIIQFPFF